MSASAFPEKQRGPLVINQLFLPRLNKGSEPFAVLWPGSKASGSESVRSLLPAGSRRGLVCLHSQVYIFVHRLCRASFYSVLSPAQCLLMHSFLSFAASFAVVSTWEGLFETRSDPNSPASMGLGPVVPASVGLFPRSHRISCNPSLILSSLRPSSRGPSRLHSFQKTSWDWACTEVAGILHLMLQSPWVPLPYVTNRG